jgi:hypothetical protein
VPVRLRPSTSTTGRVTAKAQVNNGILAVVKTQSLLAGVKLAPYCVIARENFIYPTCRKRQFQDSADRH